MKSILYRSFAAALLLVVISCNNEKTEQRSKEPTTVGPAKTAEPKKTEISVGPDGGSLKTKDVNIKLNTKDTARH